MPLARVCTRRPARSNSSRRTSPARARPKRIVARPRNGLGLGVARKSTATSSSTPTVVDPLAGTAIAVAAPQLPAASRPRTQNVMVPVSTLPVASGTEAWTVAEPNAPDIAVPLPAGAGVAPIEYSAAATAPPPISASLNVAPSVAGRVRRIGSGLTLALPATSTGPRVSPPARARVNGPLITAVEESDGKPSSVIRTRSITLVELGVGGPPRDPVRSQMQAESEQTAVVAGIQVSPASSE